MVLVVLGVVFVSRSSSSGSATTSVITETTPRTIKTTTEFSPGGKSYTSYFLGEPYLSAGAIKTFKTAILDISN